MQGKTKNYLSSKLFGQSNMHSPIKFNREFIKDNKHIMRAKHATTNIQSNKLRVADTHNLTYLQTTVKLVKSQKIIIKTHK